MREIKIRDLITAATKNGYNWVSRRERRYNISPTYGTDKSRCILEQVALNMDMPASYWTRIADGLDRFGKQHNLSRLGTEIYVYNDDEALTYEDAVKYMVEKLKAYKSETITILDNDDSV